MVWTGQATSGRARGKEDAHHLFSQRGGKLVQVVLEMKVLECRDARGQLSDSHHHRKVSADGIVHPCVLHLHNYRSSLLKRAVFGNTFSERGSVDLEGIGTRAMESNGQLMRPTNRMDLEFPTVAA